MLGVTFEATSGPSCYHIPGTAAPS